MKAAFTKLRVAGKYSDKFRPGGIGRHIGWLLLHSGTEAGAMTIAAMLAARWFGPIAWGQLGMLLAGVQLIAMFGEGFYSTMVRFVSEARTLNSPTTPWLAWKFLWTTGAILLAASVSVGLFAQVAFPGLMAPQWILLAVVLATGRGWRAALDGVYRGFHEFRLSAIAGMVCSVLMAGAIIGTAASGYRISTYMGIMLIGSAVNCGWLILMFRRKYLYGLKPTADRQGESARDFLLYSIPLALRGVCAFLFLKINVWMLGVLATEYDAGQFRLTDQFLTIPSLLLSAVLAAVAPRITGAQLQGVHILTQFMAKVYGLMLLLTLPLALFFWFNGPLLQWAFPEFVPASRMLVLFAPAMAVQGVAYAASILLVQGGRPTAALMLTLIPSGLNLASAYVGFRLYGVVGLTIATATLHFLTYVATIIVTHWLFRIPFRIRLS